MGQMARRHCSGRFVGAATKHPGLTPDAVYKIVRGYTAALGFEVGVHALRATAATNALDHQADIAQGPGVAWSRQHRHHPPLRPPTVAV